MTKRFLSLAMMITLASLAWADEEVAITNNQAITFSDATTSPTSQGIYLHAGTATFGLDGTHAASTSGTFSETSTNWSLTNVLTCSAGSSLPTIGNVGASDSGPDGTLAFNCGSAGTLHIVYGATSVNDGNFYIMQKGSGATKYSSLYSEEMKGIDYAGPFGTRANEDYKFTLAEAVVSLTSPGIVYLGGTQPYCIYAILFEPDAIYGTYDFQTWAEANMDTKNQATIQTLGGVMSGAFTPASGTVTGTMTLNGAFSIDNTTYYKLRKDGSSGATSSGLMISKTSGAKLTINRLQAGDWFVITTDVADRLQFATNNANVHAAGSTETITADSYVQSGIIYIVTAATTVDVYSKFVGTVYIHKIQISNEDAVSPPVITVGDGCLVTIDGGTSLKGNAVTVYYTTDNTDPKTSATRQAYSASFTPSETVKVRAYSVLTSDNTVESTEAEPAVVRIGTWTGETNVFDFASAANNYVDITFGDKINSEEVKYYYYTEGTSEGTAGDFYPISNTEWLTREGNDAIVAWRNGSGNAAFEDGGLISKSQKIFLVKVKENGQRVKIKFDGALTLNTANDENFIIKKSDGSTFQTTKYIGSSSSKDTEETLTIEKGGYIVLKTGNGTVIKKITVLEAALNYSLTVNYDSGQGEVTTNGNALETEYLEGTSLSLLATPAAGYQFSKWTNSDETETLSMSNPYALTLSENTTIKAAFTQPTNPAPAITEIKTWTFDAFDNGNIFQFADDGIYEYEGLYISGDSKNNPAKVNKGTSAIATEIAGDVYSNVYFAGAQNSDLAAERSVTTYTKNTMGFNAGKPGIVSIYGKGSTSERFFNFYSGGAKTQKAMTAANQLVESDVTAASNVFISSNQGSIYFYAIKFTPETVSAPTISDDGTITDGESNLTVTENKDIKTYYTTDGSDPTTESTLYDGYIDGSGEKTVKAISVNTVTGTISTVTEKVLNLVLPTVTFTASATNTEEGTVTWKVVDATECTTETSFEKGTKIEVTATPKAGYVFVGWKQGDDIVSTDATYTFTLLEATTLVAQFKYLGNTIPVILVAGQSNTDGRVPVSDLPSIETEYTGLQNCWWSYCNAQKVYAGSGLSTSYTTEGNFSKYQPLNDGGGGWAYDAVVYNEIGKYLGSDFYVIKQSKGNTSISPAAGGCGLFWSANPLWLSRNTSANEGGQSLLKAFIGNIEASLEKIATDNPGKEADIKFLMWHQGECDGAGSQGSAYYTQLKAMINYVRNYLAQKNAKYSNLPIVLGGIPTVSAQYKEVVEAAKQQLANEDANIYYVAADMITSIDGLIAESTTVHFNAESAKAFGASVWQTIKNNSLMIGLEEGTGSNTPVADILSETTISATTKWNFSEETVNTKYSNVTNKNGLYLIASSSRNMTVKEMSGISSVKYRDGEEVTTTKALYTEGANRSAWTKYGLTAGDISAVDRSFGVNVGEAGTFYAILAPDTEPTGDQTTRTIYLVVNGEKVDEVNALEAWNNENHLVELKYRMENAGTIFLMSDHAINLYAAKFVKAGEETGGFQIKVTADGGTVTIVSPEGKTLDDYFEKDTEVTLKAEPADDSYAFEKWTGDVPTGADATNNVLTLTLDADKQVTAVFRHTVTYDFYQLYKDNNEFDVGISETKSTVYYYKRTDDTTGEDANGNFYALTASPVSGTISWREANVQLTANGLQATKGDRPFAIHGLKAGDVVRLEFTGDIYYAKHSTRGSALEGMTSGEYITRRTAYTVSEQDVTNDYVVFYPTQNTYIQQIAINQEIIPLPEQPTVAYKQNKDGKAVYTITSADDNNIKYQLGEAAAVDAQATSADVEVSQKTTLTAWAYNGDKESAKFTGDLMETPIVETDGNFDFSSTGLESNVSIVVDESQEVLTVDGVALYKPGLGQAPTFANKFAMKKPATGNTALRSNQLHINTGETTYYMAVLNAPTGKAITITADGTGKMYAGDTQLSSGVQFKITSEVLTNGHLVLKFVVKDADDSSIGSLQIKKIEFVEPTEMVGKPTISVADKVVTITGGTSNEGNAVTTYYTLDGSTPTAASAVYTEPVTITDTRIVKAISISGTEVASEVATQKVFVEGASPAMTLDFMNDESLAPLAWGDDHTAGYYNNGSDKSSSDFRYLTNAPIHARISWMSDGNNTENAAVTTGTGMKVVNSSRAFAINDLAVGDVIYIAYTTTGDKLTTSKHSAKGNTVKVGDVTATGDNALTEIEPYAKIEVTEVDADNNYVMFMPNKNITIQSIAINQEIDPESYKVAPPTVTYNAESSSKTKAVYVATFAEGQSLHYILPGAETAKAASYKAEGVTMTATENGTLEYWTKEGTAESEHQTITVNTIAARPTVTFKEVSGSTSVYSIAFSKGNTLCYTLNDGEQQTIADATSPYELQVTETAELKVWGKIGDVESDVLTVRYVYAPTPSIVENGIYDFSKASASKDFTLGFIGYGEAVNVGGITLYKPDEVVSRTLDRFAFAPKLNENGKNAADWVLLGAGRLRSKNSVADTLAVIDLNQGDYITFTYSGAELKYMSQSTATLADGTDVLTSGQGYEVMTAGALLLTVPTDGKNCDITKIAIANGEAETVTAPTVELRSGFNNRVTITPGTSNIGKSVTTYYTTDGTDPTTESTAITEKTNIGPFTERTTVKAISISETGKSSEMSELVVTPDSYTITISSDITGGTVTADKTEAAQSEDVKLTVTPDEGYSLDILTANNGAEITASNAFKMPAANVTITATFKKTEEIAEDEVKENVSIDENTGTAKLTSIIANSGTTVITISGEVNNAPITSIGTSTFTAKNTANIAAIDLSETTITLTGERSELNELKNINSATLIYLPATANVTGTNIVSFSDEDGRFNCPDYEITDGNACIIPHEFYASEAKLNRTFMADKKCTICLPYAFKAEGGTFYKFTGISNGKVQMTAQEDGSDLEANTPYIFVPSNDEDALTTEKQVLVKVGDARTGNAAFDFTFVGTYENTKWDNPVGIYGFAAEENGIATIGQFVRVGSGASILACRAYLQYTGDKLSDVFQTRADKMDNLPDKLEIEWIPVSKNSGTTSINDAVQRSAEDTPIYNINGQRVDNSYKGLVIKNGKKIVKK